MEINIETLTHTHEILKRLDHLQIQGEQIKMAMTAAEQNILDQFQSGMTAIGNRLSDLAANAPTDNPEFLAALQADADLLKAMGTPVVANPTPEAPAATETASA